MFSEHIEKAMRKLEGWWHGELIDDRVCIGFVVPKPGRFLINNRKNLRLLYSLVRWYFSRRRASSKGSLMNLKRRDIASSPSPLSIIYSHFNKLWPHPAEKDVDIEKFVEEGINMLHSASYFGEVIPKFIHQYGARGFPMTMRAYLGADLEFLEDTILSKPFINNWKEVDLKLQPPNLWYEMSLKLVELATQKSKGEFLVDIPDLGDVLTNLYLMRGPAIFQDIGFEPKMLETRDKFIKLWIEAYESFWKITSQKFPGSSHWLIWAPGKSYVCQCDASCTAVSGSKKEVAPILLARIVEDFIIPEMERLGKYLDYIVWHLDGEEELQFLDTLLEMPQIKAIQWRPISGNPADVEWLPLLKKIQDSKRSIWLTVQNEKEVERLIENLSPERLYMSGGFTGKTEKEAREFLKWVESLTRARIKNRSFSGFKI